MPLPTRGDLRKTASEESLSGSLPRTGVEDRGFERPSAVLASRTRRFGAIFRPLRATDDEDVEIAPADTKKDV